MPRPDRDTQLIEIKCEIIKINSLLKEKRKKSLIMCTENSNTFLYSCKCKHYKQFSMKIKA